MFIRTFKQTLSNGETTLKFVLAESYRPKGAKNPVQKWSKYLGTLRERHFFDGNRRKILYLKMNQRLAQIGITSGTDNYQLVHLKMQIKFAEIAKTLTPAIV
jgi:hypothetical protein